MYQTGSTADVFSLLTLLQNFLVTTAGYTVNRSNSTSNNTRLQVSKSGRYFNFAIPFAQDVSGSFTGQYTSLLMNAGTGYSSGSDWYNQPGTMVSLASNYFISAMIDIGVVSSYHFFYKTSSDYDCVYVFVESNGIWQRLLFGKMATNNYNTWSGLDGMFYQGSKAPLDHNPSLALSLFGASVPDWVSEAPQGAVFGNVELNQNWMSGNWSIPNASFSPRFQVFDSISKQSYIWLNAENASSGAPCALPIQILATRGSTADAGVNTEFSFVGSLPDIFWANITNLVPGSTIKIGQKSYVVFPFTKKSDTWKNDVPANGTYNFGLIVKK